MRHSFGIKVGPIGFRIGSDWRAPIAALETLYASYPDVEFVPQYTVRLQARRPWRRMIRPAVHIGGDFTLPEAAPLPLGQRLLAAEMGMNLQLALGERRFLLLHAASVERDGRMLILTGESGAGKSTLSAMLGERDWRFMGDEFSLIEPETGLGWPVPRPVSLKNASIDAFPKVAAARWGPDLFGTPKGRIRHLVPGRDALSTMNEPARPAAIVFPRFGQAAAVRVVTPSETFVRLTQASTNYVALGERGFVALTALTTGVPALAVDYPDAKAAFRQLDDIWKDL